MSISGKLPSENQRGEGVRRRRGAACARMEMLSRDLDVLEIARAVVDADLGRRDP
jgi:hypothetical protein